MRTRITILGALLSLLLSQVAWSQEYHNATVVVIDASGSMNDSMKDKSGNDVSKMRAAKDALKFVVSQLPPNEWIGILVFSSTSGAEWEYGLAPIDVATVNAAIERPEPHGNTPLGLYMKKGADRLLEEREKQHGYGNYRLIVVTDGEENVGHYVDEYTPMILARGLRIDAIGVKMSSQHTLASKVNTYRSAQNPEELRAALQQAFHAEVGAGDKISPEEAYTLVAALPDGPQDDPGRPTREIISALATQGNHPIGEAPPKRADPASASSAQSTPDASQASTPQAASGGSSWGWWVFGGIIVIVVLILAIKWAVDEGILD
jgi:hypothetical protein